MANIKGILFDKDGTLVDFQATWHAIGDLMAMKAARGDRKMADALMDSAGYDIAAGRFRGDSVFAAGTNSDIVSLWYPEMSQGERLAMVEQFDQITAIEGAEQAVALPGVIEALRELHGQGYRLGVATNDSTAGAERTLSALGISQLFEAAYGYDAVANPKPAADPVIAFCDLTGLKPSEVAMIGDNGHDLEMAHNAACGLAVGVLSGTGSADALARRADVVLASVADLPDYLAGL